uniref:Protein male-specific lethal-3 n=1 Tax=Drosophila virilis TaxID=7244 RepID=MSL3_DROVI|nr:RecName: Full=Protein male-specific lethal-3 [Drosophila virilis]AAF88149.1 male-specific lethal-3 [Drosophila virilis]
MTAHENEVQLFNRGEKVLCYEPDESKARVLYDSKVLAVYERKDAANLRYFDYKIHFQGWNSSWDRNVRAASLLKDNEENRKLQRELAEAAQLQKTGGYSYKDSKTPTLPSSKKKRLARGGHVEDPTADPLDISLPSSKKKRLARGGHVEDPTADPLDISLAHLPATPKPELPAQQKRGARSRDGSGNRSRDGSGNRSRDNSSGRKKQRDKSKGGDKNDDGERRSARSQFSLHVSPKDTHTTDAEKRIHQEDRVMLRISERLREYMEYDYNMVCKLEKQHALPARTPIVTILENFVKQRAVELAIGIKQDSSRARNTLSRNARMEREYDRVMSIVCMLKEVVDGLRIYFEFHLEDHLLYREEKDYALGFLTDNNMKNCSLLLNKSYEFINPSGDNELISMAGNVNGTNGVDGPLLGDIEYENQLQKCLRYIEKNSAKNNIALAYTAAYKLPMEMRGFLRETFSWSLLSEESPPEKSIIFGAPHLARMLVLLPECLNASPISNEKLVDLLPHLDSFINYLENHKEWFDKQNYLDPLIDQGRELSV